MMSKTANEGVPAAVLTLAVVTSFTIGGVGYLSGSTPEWIVLKSSIGLLMVGLMGWMVSMFISTRSIEANEKIHTDKGANVDLTVSEATQSETALSEAESGTDMTVDEAASVELDEDGLATTNAVMR